MDLIEIKGKINTAICYARVVEDEAIEQIRRMCDYPMTEGSRIRIMPDVHSGKGCTIGTTMTITDKAVPNVVGVDIGCGMYTVNLGKVDIDFVKVDEAAHFIPSGMNVWEGRQERFDLTELACYRELKDTKRLERSLGTLGGGNHFIEIDEAGDGTKYLVIHSGSRNLGKQVAELYQKLADSTFRRDEQDIRRILPALGNYKLTDLRKEVIRDFYDEMRHTPRLDGRGNLSEKSVEGLHNTLCGILSAAVDEGYLTHNPAWRCYKPKGQKKERPVADEETVKKLITAFEGQSMKYETYFKLVLATGLRRGEACGLKWSDINWHKRTIHVQRGVVKLSHQESITKDPKTSSGDRMVYLSKEMCQLLKAWRKECEWDRQQTANETVSEDDYLFRQPNGKPMNPCTFTYRFKLILKANNLPLDLNVHSLRHTNASLLIAQGVDVRTVASLLGHAQASTTLDIYAHAFDKNKRKAQEKLGKAIGL